MVLTAGLAPASQIEIRNLGLYLIELRQRGSREGSCTLIKRFEKAVS